MTMLPAAYPSPLHLPFNREALREGFRIATPDADPGGDGSWVLLRGSELLVEEADGALSLPAGESPPVSPGRGEPLYLGSWQERPCRALRLAKDAAVPAGLAAENLLAGEPRLPIELLSLGGTAGQVLHWERSSRHCSLCGGATARIPGEWGKRCRCCGYQHFPHIHPCAIVLVRRADEVLLVRKPGWPEGRYGLVAGFLDVGECLEEAAAREVLEETGLHVKDVRYVGSQCWPFPSQLMAGFVAEYAGGEIRVEEQELEDARWFPLSSLPALPPRRSIARYLIDRHARA